MTTQTLDSVLLKTDFPNLELFASGKVRDVYRVGNDRLLFVATDRISAFDYVLATGIPHKGRVLTQISNFWFQRTRHIVPNHLADYPLARAVPDAAERAPLEERSIVVRRLKALPIEAVVRGYLIGSGWKDYQQSGAVCGIALPAGLRQADRLPEPIFTPATKAEMGSHDENIPYERVVALIGRGLAEQVRATALALYGFAVEHALQRGIIIADTKFEFGVDDVGHLTLIDEALTPDSSRFWPADTYRPGTSPPSFDKQYVRDYLETLDWPKRPPGPKLPPEIVARTSEKYAEALRRLTS